MKQLLNPALLIALGFHAILLALPLSQDSQSVEAESQSTEEIAQPSQLPSPQLVVKPTPELQEKTPAKSKPKKKLKASVKLQSQRKSQSQPKKVVYSQQKLQPIKARSPEEIPKSEPVRVVGSDPLPTQPRETVPTIAKDSQPEPIPTVKTVSLLNPFDRFPVYPFKQSLRGSLELRSPKEDRATYAFNTRDTMEQVTEFYQTEVPKKGFKSLELKTDRADLKTYQVTSNPDGTSQYLHILPFAGRTVIFLSAEEVTDLDPLKEKAREKLAAKQQFLSRLLSGETSLNPMSRAKESEASQN